MIKATLRNSKKKKKYNKYFNHFKCGTASIMKIVNEKSALN